MDHLYLLNSPVTCTVDVDFNLFSRQTMDRKGQLKRTEDLKAAKLVLGED